MASITQTTKTYELAAKNAILYASPTDPIGQCGIALRDQHGHVFFQADHTGTWIDITDIERGRIQLCGDVSLELAAKISDGNLVLKCSRSLQGRAA